MLKGFVPPALHCIGFLSLLFSASLPVPANPANLRICCLLFRHSAASRCLCSCCWCTYMLRPSFRVSAAFTLPTILCYVVCCLLLSALLPLFIHCYALIFFHVYPHNKGALLSEPDYSVTWCSGDDYKCLSKYPFAAQVPKFDSYQQRTL